MQRIMTFLMNLKQELNNVVTIGNRNVGAAYRDISNEP